MHGEQINELSSIRHSTRPRPSIRDKEGPRVLLRILHQPPVMLPLTYFNSICHLPLRLTGTGLRNNDVPQSGRDRRVKSTEDDG